MGRGLTTDERAGTDTLSEAWLAQRLFTGTSHLNPCGPVAAGCYGASAAELELEGVPLVLSGCRPLTGTVTAARPVPLTGSLSGSRLRPSQMFKRNLKLNLNLKYDPVPEWSRCHQAR